MLESMLQLVVWCGLLWLIFENQSLRKKTSVLDAKLDFLSEKLNVSFEGFAPSDFNVQQVRKLMAEGKVPEAKQLAKERFTSVQQFKDAARKP